MTGMTVTEKENTLENAPLKIDPIQTAKGIYITIHGHFYQPPRENPYLNTIERQPSAYPFHDWNERIHHECYRSNAFARIFNNQGEIVGIVNNFEYLSFNMGPTLMSWLEKYDMEVYNKIIEADRLSCKRLNGHGNAIAQVYNHIILPLANERDKYTQIRWGKQDFCKRFHRQPEGMWLAETAVDYATLEVLIAEGIKFIILAPSQALKCRPFPTEKSPKPEWLKVGGGQIDPTRPYRCFINENDYIDIFFYDGPISGDIGFGDVLTSSNHFVNRLQLAIRGDHRKSQIISVGTDGETFGHHKKNGEKCLAYAFKHEFPNQGWNITNFAHYLSINPPNWEVELKSVTAWSCAHGVERWQNDCGCGGGEGITLKWRRPLRDALNWLRDELIKVYEEVGYRLFKNPWLARDEYIEIILNRSSEKIENFFARHTVSLLNPAEKIDALRLLEMQRHTLLMFTSCGWFFEEISRPEGKQVLLYAARALELAGEVAGVQLDQQFVDFLANAPSNAKYANAAEFYTELITNSQVNLEQVAAHYAISSLFTKYQPQQPIYCYNAHQLDYKKQQIGSLTLAVGQVNLISDVTLEMTHFIFAVLHLGGWDFHCCIQPFSSRLVYSQLKDQLFDSFKQASIVETILVMSRLFGNKSFNLEHLFSEERHSIIEKLTVKTKQRLDQLYTQIYRENYSILLAFQRDNLPVPQELQVAAEVAISHICLKTITELDTKINDPTNIQNILIELEAIASEANQMSCKLTISEGKKILEKLILDILSQMLNEENSCTPENSILIIEKMIKVGKKLYVDLSLDQPQELFYNYLHHQILSPSNLEKVNENKTYDSSNNRFSSTKQISSAIVIKLGEILKVKC